MSDDQRPVEIDEFVEASPEEAFEYVADPDRRAFGDSAPVEFGDEIERDPPSRISWEVNTTEGGTTHSGIVEIAISPDGAGSRVRVTHRVDAPSRIPQPSAELALAS